MSRASDGLLGIGTRLRHLSKNYGVQHNAFFFDIKLEQGTQVVMIFKVVYYIRELATNVQESATQPARTY